MIHENLKGSVRFIKIKNGWFSGIFLRCDYPWQYLYFWLLRGYRHHEALFGWYLIKNFKKEDLQQ